MVSRYHQFVPGISQVSDFFSTQIASFLGERTQKRAELIAATTAKAATKITVTSLAPLAPAAILKLSGPLDVKNYVDLIGAAREAIAAGAQSIIFDLGDVTGLRLTSMYALHSIVALLQGKEPLDLLGGNYTYRAIAQDLMMGNKQEQLKLANPQPQVLAQLTQMGFIAYLDICQDVDAAVAAL
jgi:hypothetical protein